MVHFVIVEPRVWKLAKLKPFISNKCIIPFV